MVLLCRDFTIYDGIISKEMELTPLVRLLMYTKNIAGPRTDPWGRGTPDVTGRLSDSAPSTTTDCVLPLRKLLIHSSVVESMPYWCSDDMSLL